MNEPFFLLFRRGFTFSQLLGGVAHSFFHKRVFHNDRHGKGRWIPLASPLYGQEGAQAK